MTHTLSITKAREDLPTLVNNAQKKLHDYVITVNGKRAAVIISADEYDCWQETNEILADKKLMKDIKEAEEDMKKGRYEDWEDVKKELGWE